MGCPAYLTHKPSTGQQWGGFAGVIAHRGVPRIVIISDAEISPVISVRFAREIHTLDKKLNHYHL